MTIEPSIESRAIAVVIPVKNGAEFLLRALKSVEAVAASIRDSVSVEVVVVDDGSGASIPEIIDIGRFRMGVSIVRGAERGVSAARNLGAQKTEAAFLCFLDVDDMLTHDWGVLAVRVFEKSGCKDIPAARAGAIVENAISEARREVELTWLPGAYIIGAHPFSALGGFDETVHWGEHHQLGRRIVRHYADQVVELPGVYTVVKVDDRSAAIAIGYAARRAAAATSAMSELPSALGQATAHDTIAVSMARLSRWTEASTAADSASACAATSRRSARRVLVRIPVARWVQYQGVLHVREVGWILAGLARRTRRILTVASSVLVAQVRGPQDYQ